MLIVHLLLGRSEDARTSGQVLCSRGRCQVAEGLAGEWRRVDEKVQGWRASTQGGGGGLEGKGKKTWRDIHQAEKLTEANVVQTAKVASLYKSIEMAKANAFEGYKDSQDFFDLLGSQYGECFEDFHKQATVLFPDVDFSSVQIDISVPMTPKADDEVDDIEDEDRDKLEGETAQPKLKKDGLLKPEGPMEEKANPTPIAWFIFTSVFISFPFFNVISEQLGCPVLSHITSVCLRRLFLFLYM